MEVNHDLVRKERSMKNYNLFDCLIITLVTIGGIFYFLIFALYAAGLIW